MTLQFGTSNSKQLVDVDLAISAKYLGRQ